MLTLVTHKGTELEAAFTEGNAKHQEYLRKTLETKTCESCGCNREQHRTVQRETAGSCRRVGGDAREKASQKFVRIEREVDVKLGRLQAYHKGLFDTVDLEFLL